MAPIKLAQTMCTSLQPTINLHTRGAEAYPSQCGSRTNIKLLMLVSLDRGN